MPGRRMEGGSSEAGGIESEGDVLSAVAKRGPKSAATKQRESYVDPLRTNGSTVVYLGDIMLTRMSDRDERYDGMDRTSILTSANIELPIGECTSCGELVFWKWRNRSNHMKKCSRMAGRKRKV